MSLSARRASWTSASARLTGQVAGHPEGVLPDRRGLPLGLTGPIRLRHGLGQRRLALGEPRHRGLEGGDRLGQRLGGAGRLGAQVGQLGASAERSRRGARAREEDRAAGPAEHAAALVQHLGAGRGGPDPGGRRLLDPQSAVQWPLGPADRAGIERQQHQRARLLLRVPSAHRGHRSFVADDDGVHPVTQQPLHQLGVLALRAHEVAQRSQHPSIEALADGEQGGGSGGQAHAVALELLQRVASGAELGHGLLGLAAVGAMHRLPLPRGGDLVPGVLRGGGAALGLVTQEPGPLDGAVAAALGVGQLGPQAGSLGRGLGNPLPQRGELAIQGGPLALERALRVGQSLQSLLPLAHPLPLLPQPAADLLLRLGPSGELLPDPGVLDRRGLAVARCRLLLQRRALGPQLHLGPLFAGAEPPRLGVGQALAGEGKIALEPAELELDRRQPPRQIGAMGLGRRAVSGRVLAPVLGLGDPVPSGGQHLGQLGEPGLHVAHVRGELLQQAARERHLNRELLFGELDVSFRLAALPGEASDLGLDFGDQILDPLEVDRGLLQAPLGAVLPVAIEADPGGLFEQAPPLVGAVGEQQVDHLRFDHDARVAAEPGAAEEILDVAQPHRGAVEQVVALARAGEAPGHHHLAVGDGEVAVAVVEVEGDLGDVHRAPGGGALEDHVLHLAAAEQPGRLLAQDPPHRVGDVGLAAAVGADDRRDAVLEGQGDAVGEGLEPGELQLGQLHGADPVRASPDPGW